MYEVAVDVWLAGGETSTLVIRGVGRLPGMAAAAGGLQAGDGDRSAWLGYSPIPTLPPAGDFELSTHAVVLGTVGWCKLKPVLQAPGFVSAWN